MMRKSRISLGLMNDNDTPSSGCCSKQGSTGLSCPAKERPPYVVEERQTAAGMVPVVSSVLSKADRFGALLVRCNVGRKHYRVEPGLYALGRPGERSPVLVTANYKLSFDTLRSSLRKQHAWILVLDTKGVNVWCAAGKGTFGTDELAARIQAVDLASVVSGRTVILPQLSATGVAAYQLPKKCGFRAVFGPVKALDLPAFFEAGNKADQAMRVKSFSLAERAVLIPAELKNTLQVGIPLALLASLLFGIGSSGLVWDEVLSCGIALFAVLSGALLAGCILVPLLLPWLPGRAFSLKGLWAGLAVAAPMILFLKPVNAGWNSILEPGGMALVETALASFLAMGFTGSSTFTSLSGVKKEMRSALPLQIAGAVTGLVFWILARVAL